MADRPVPPVVDGQAAKQRLAALEQLLQRVEEQALAEPPRPRKEVAASLVRQALRVAGLVDVIAVLLPKRAEGLDADGKLASRHGVAAAVQLCQPSVRLVHSWRADCDQIPAELERAPGLREPPRDEADHLSRLEAGRRTVSATTSLLVRLAVAWELTQRRGIDFRPTCGRSSATRKRHLAPALTGCSSPVTGWSGSRGSRCQCSLARCWSELSRPFSLTAQDYVFCRAITALVTISNSSSGLLVQP